MVQNHAGGVRRVRRRQVQPFDHYSSGGGAWVSCHVYMHVCILIYICTFAEDRLQLCICMYGCVVCACMFANLNTQISIYVGICAHRFRMHLFCYCTPAHDKSCLLCWPKSVQSCLLYQTMLMLSCSMACQALMWHMLLSLRVLRCAKLCHDNACNASSCISSCTLTLTC